MSPSFLLTPLLIDALALSIPALSAAEGKLDRLAKGSRP